MVVTLSGDVSSNLVISSDGQATFSAAVPIFNVSTVQVTTQPHTDGGVVCDLQSVFSNVVIMQYQNITIACKYRLRANVVGYPGGGNLAVTVTDAGSVAITGASQQVLNLISFSRLTYTATVTTQSSFSTCYVSSTSGSIGALIGPVDINIGCNVTISGSAMGIPGAGLPVTLSGGGSVVFINQNGGFTFGSAVSPFTYHVVAAASSPAYNCSVTFGDGTNVQANFMGVAVRCEYFLSVRVSNMPTYTASSLVVSLNGIPLSFAIDGLQRLNTLSFGLGSSVVASISSQPQDARAGVQCGFLPGFTPTGSANSLTDVYVFNVTCLYEVRGYLVGMAGTGLSLINLVNNDVKSLSADQSFGFPTFVNGSFNLAVRTDATGSKCAILRGATGLVSPSLGPFTSVIVVCNTTVSGTVAGLPSSQTLTLQNGQGSSVVVTGTAADIVPFNFGQQITGSAYTVTKNPDNLLYNCTVYRGTGLASANITDVAIICEYFVSITVANLPGAFTLNINAPIPASTFMFSVDGTQRASNSYVRRTALSLAVGAQPTGGRCAFTIGNVTTLIVNQLTDSNTYNVLCSYQVGGLISGYSGSGLSLLNSNNGEIFVVMPGATSFVFNNFISGSFVISLKTDASTSFCKLSNNASVISTAAYNSVQIDCFVSIGGNHIGLPTGKTLTLQLGAGETLVITGNSGNTIPFTFKTLLPTNTPYSVSISVNDPNYNCTVYQGSGTATANVNSISVVCEYFVDITVVNMWLGAPSALVVTQTQSYVTTLTFNNDAMKRFPRSVQRLTTPSITVTSPSPTDMNCTASNSLIPNIADNVVITVTCAYAISGTITGYAGSDMRLQLQGFAALTPIVAPPASQAFTFGTSQATFGTKVVSIFQAPSQVVCLINGMPSTSAVTINTWTGPINNVSITCDVTVGGFVSRLVSSTGLTVYETVSGQPKAISGPSGALKSYTFDNHVPTGSPFSVTAVSPRDENCTVYGGTGSAGVIINTINVTCEYFVNATVRGLVGTGLTVDLNYGSASHLFSVDQIYDPSFNARTDWRFPRSVAYNTPFTVAVTQQPTLPSPYTSSDVSCFVANAGTSPLVAPASNVAVQCEYSVFGKAYDVAGGPFNITLRQAAYGHAETLSINNGAFAFKTKIAPDTFVIQVDFDPTLSSCAFDSPPTSGAGPVNLTVVCGITITVDVQRLFGDNMRVQYNSANPTNVNHDISAPLKYTTKAGQPYNIVITQQPTVGGVQKETCTVYNGTGIATGNTNATIRCDYWVFATVNNQVMGDTLSLKLTQFGTNVPPITLPLTHDGTPPNQVRFSDPYTIAYGTRYFVEISGVSFHDGQNCSIISANNGVVTQPFTVTVNCAYSVGGSITGLSGNGLLLRNNGGDQIALASGASSFTFPTYINGAYNVTVVAQPSNSICTVSNNAGTAVDKVFGVSVVCKVRVSGTLTAKYGASVDLSLTVGGSVVETITLTSNAAWQFVGLVPTDSPYSIAVSAQSDGGALENCTVVSANRAGVASAHVTNVAVNCEYFVGGTITGFYGTPLIVGEPIIGPYSISAPSIATANWQIARSTVKNAPYTISIQTQANSQFNDVVCSVVSGGSGWASVPISNITIACKYRLFFNVSGLVGNGLVVKNSPQSDTKAVTLGNGRYMFTNVLLSPAESFTVQVQTQPDLSTCSVSAGTGSGTSSGPVYSPRVVCGILVGGVVRNATFLSTLRLRLSGPGFVDGFANVSANGNFQFADPIPTGSSYTVSVATNPTHETCIVSNATGSAISQVTNIAVDCDFNECEVNYGGCDYEASCHNLLHVGWYCTCNSGFEGSGFTCTDVNECQLNNGDCLPTSGGGVCTNTWGSRRCSCISTKFGDGLTVCHDKSDCTFSMGAFGNGGCAPEAKCDPFGTPHCACNFGYMGQTGETADGGCHAVPASATASFFTVNMYAPVDTVQYAKFLSDLPYVIADILSIDWTRVAVISSVLVGTPVTNPTGACGVSSGQYQKVTVTLAITELSGDSAASRISQFASAVNAVSTGSSNCSTIGNAPISTTSGDAPAPTLSSQPLTLCSDNLLAPGCPSSSSPVAAIAAAIIIILVVAAVIGFLCWRKRKTGRYCCCGGGNPEKDMELREMDQSTDLHIAVGAQGTSSLSAPPSAASTARVPGVSAGGASAGAAVAMGAGGAKKRKAPATLRDLLTGDPAYIAVWKAQLAKEFSTENMSFYEAVEDYRKMKLDMEQKGTPDAQLRKSLFPKAKEIMSGFVAHDVGSAQVNIPENVEARLQKLFRQKFYTTEKITYIYGPDSEQAPDDDSSYPRPVTPTIFDESQEVIFKLMENDSFPRFIKSREYKALAAQ